MSSSPESQPEADSQTEDSLVSSQDTPSEPPPSPDDESSDSPPSDDSPPPPTSASPSPPPPTTGSPPPVTDESPPPSPPNGGGASPPPSPKVASPPPSPNVASSPPDSDSDSTTSPPPPDDASITTLSTDSLDNSNPNPPPRKSRTRAPPMVPRANSVTTDSDYPDSGPVTAVPDSTTTTPAFVSPPPIDPLSPPAPPTSTSTATSTSPEGTSNDTSATPASSSNSSPRNPMKSGNPNSKASDSSTVGGSPNASDNNDQAVKAGVAIGVVVAAVIIGFMLAVLFVQRRRKKHSQYNSVYVLPSPYNASPDSGTSFIKGNATGGAEYLSSSDNTGGLGNTKSFFSYEELTTVTNGFSSQNILGAGGFGCVYKGVLSDGKEVAIKKLKDHSGQGEREFQAEVEIISRVHHRYLVSLVGHCISDHQRLLVYEFVPNGTLHHHLHSSKKPPMAWPLRVKVACGSARGIAYLHEDCHPRIIHRDIKSANILVDNNFEAKVADFGLAKLAQDLESNTHISTRVMGTFGYMAPEYASSGKLTEKSDVFSYGVVLLEMITGRKPVDETRPIGDESLVEWARPLMTEALENGNFNDLADPRLQGDYDQGEMYRLIEAAAACVRHSAVKRPKMSQVVRSLDAHGEISDLSNGMKPGQSGIYDSREHSAQIRLFQRMAFGSEEFNSENYNTQGNTQGNWQSGGRSGVL